VDGKLVPLEYLEADRRRRAALGRATSRLATLVGGSRAFHTVRYEDLVLNPRRCSSG
jgi:hypothetical protein